MEPWKNHLFIVFCVDHYNPLGIIRSLGENGIAPRVIVVDEGCAPLVSSSKYASDVRRVCSIDEGFSALIDIIDAYDSFLPFVITSDDEIESHLDMHYDDLAGKCYFFNAGRAGGVTCYMNKDAINKLAIECGLKVLDAVAVRRGDLAHGLQYPLITKSIASIVGGWKDDVFICHNESELAAAYKRISSDDVLLQRYIEKKNECALEGISVLHGDEVFVSIASSYNYLLPSSYSPYMTVSNFDDVDIVCALKTMMAKIRFEGIFEAEFLVDADGERYFCEINFRNSTWSYASTCAGMPLPVLWAKAMVEGGISEEIRKEVPEGFSAMVEPTDFKERVLKKRTGLVGWLRDLRRCDCRYYLGKKDCKPVVSFLADRMTRRK